MVTGAARYTVDVRLPGMLFARILRSPHPHARILSIDTSAAERHSGVRAVHVVTENSRAAGRPATVSAPGALPTVRYVGASIAAIAATTRSSADVIVDGEFRTQVQTHCCLEPHAIVADWRAEGLTVYISTQDTVGVRNDLAAAFGLARERVRVVTEYMGGGFGSKLSVGDYGYIAVELSRKAAAPVALVFDRSEEQQAGGNRPGTWQRLRIGARRDGTLTAISLLSYGTAGVDLGAGVGNIAQAMYECPNFEMAQHDVFTHAAPGCPMRAPGNVQGAFALEQMIDELADKLNLDPLALRDRIDPSTVRREERRIGAERFGWGTRRPAGAHDGPVKRGVGVAQSFWPGIVQTSAACEVRLDRDGSVELRSSVQDIGSGIRTLLAQVVAEELGLRPEDISVRIGDTDFPPGPSSGGSKTAGSITPAARKAAYQVRQKLFAAAAPALGTQPADLAVCQGRNLSSQQPLARHQFPASDRSPRPGGSQRRCRARRQLRRLSPQKPHEHCA